MSSPTAVSNFTVGDAAKKPVTSSTPQTSRARQAIWPSVRSSTTSSSTSLSVFRLSGDAEDKRPVSEL
eukprot:2709597-Rhodomonas_salina.1